MEQSEGQQGAGARSGGVLPLFPAAAASLFPITQVNRGASGAPSWLSNSSFSQSLLPTRAVEAAPAEAPQKPAPAPDEAEAPGVPSREDAPELLEKKKRKKKKEDKEERHGKKHRKQEAKHLAEDSLIGNLKGSRSERKAAPDIWLNDSGWQKEYYFDVRGDRDNLAFESIYRYDLARYHPHHSKEIVDAGKLWARKVGLLNPETDSSTQDESLRSAGRYWSLKATSAERQRDFKRLLLAHPRSGHLQPDSSLSFLSLDLKGGEQAEPEKPREECWEDYVLNKTKLLNEMTRDEPENEELWIKLANFQDEIIQAEKRKTLAQHAIDKKILLLERALELHPSSEKLMLLYLETSKRRDDLSTLLSKWERIIMKNSGSYRLWQQYLRLRRSSFSRFSVSEIRKLYSQALQALAAARSRQQTEASAAELGIVAVFWDLCRFEWQTGHHELAIGLVQAEFEYGFLCPVIQLSQSSKLRLFEEFWNSGAARIGEPGALGWCNWMQQQEERIQKAKEMSGLRAPEQEAGNTELFSGWREQELVGQKGADPSPNAMDEDEEEEALEEDDAALLEKLGLNLDLAKDAEIKDARVWRRWSEEEARRDREQWLPVRGSRAGGHENDDEDEGLEKMVMFDDVRENLFSLSTEQARLHFLGQFLEFCNAPLFQWCCSNARGFREKFDLLDGLNSELYAAVSGEEQSWDDLLPPLDWIKESPGRAGFIRNTLLLLRDSFSHKLHFQEVLISLEAMDSCEGGESSGDGSEASRVLAKSLLKANRQDLTLWAAYACFEASTGNVETARKVFDTALTSISALPKEAQADAPVVYLAYAEVEMAQPSEDPRRVLNILHFLGVSEPYKPSSSSDLTRTQVLRTLRGYQEQLQKLYNLQTLTETGASLVICAALFQQLTSGWEAATLIFEESLANLPGGDSPNVHLERLLHCYIAMLESQRSSVKPATMRRIIKQGVEEYPSNFKLLSSYRQASLIGETRRFVDELLQRSPSTILWLFALSCELARPGASSRIHNVFERALEGEGNQHSVLIWRLYIAYELKRNNPDAARRVFFRAIHACPWSKVLWMDGFQKMNSLLSVKELSDLVDVMRDKELRIRTDVYEILLEEADPLV